MKITNIAPSGSYCTLNVFKKDGTSFEFTLHHGESIYVELEDLTKPLIMQERKGNILLTKEGIPEKLEYYVCYTPEKIEEILTGKLPVSETIQVEEEKPKSNALSNHKTISELGEDEEKEDYDTEIPKGKNVKKSPSNFKPEKDTYNKVKDANKYEEEIKPFKKKK